MPHSHAPHTSHAGWARCTGRNPPKGDAIIVADEPSCEACQEILYDEACDRHGALHYDRYGRVVKVKSK